MFLQTFFFFSEKFSNYLFKPHVSWICLWISGMWKPGSSFRHLIWDSLEPTSLSHSLPIALHGFYKCSELNASFMFLIADHKHCIWKQENSINSCISCTNQSAVMRWIMLSNVDAGQSRKTKRCYTPAEYCCNSPSRPADGGNNFVLLTR